MSGQAISQFNLKIRLSGVIPNVAPSDEVCARLFRLVVFMLKNIVQSNGMGESP